MAFSPKQWRAIKMYMDNHDVRPELSVFPFVRFSNKTDGEIQSLHITALEDFYFAQKERDKRLKSEERKTARKNGGRR